MIAVSKAQCSKWRRQLASHREHKRVRSPLRPHDPNIQTLLLPTSSQVHSSYNPSLRPYSLGSTQHHPVTASIAVVIGRHVRRKHDALWFDVVDASTTHLRTFEHAAFSRRSDSNRTRLAQSDNSLRRAWTAGSSCWCFDRHPSTSAYATPREDRRSIRACL